MMATPDIQPSKQVQQLVDRISELPDGILSHTLSFLTLKDAARTSVLSKRWIDVWKFTKKLDFNYWKNLKDIKPTARDYYAMHRIERCKQVKYVGWVNKVLQSHKAMDLDMFRISFSDLNESHRDHLHNWIKFAFARKVQKFEMDLGGCSVKHPFIFPGHLLSRFDSLKSLTLKRISVSGEELEFLLHNCPFLEHLLVEIASKLKELKVCGSSIALKHLEINFCDELCSLMVCDSNLISLRTNEGKKLVLKNPPKLVDVFVSQHSFHPTYSTMDALSWVSCCLSNLEAITLRASEIDGEWDAAEAGIPQLIKLKQFTLVAYVDAAEAGIPQLIKLKQFTLVAYVDEKDESLLSYTSLIRASPNLEKFVLKVECFHGTVFPGRVSKKGARLPLQHLKVVEFEGYYGSTTEVELVEYFAENAVSLKTIVVDPSFHFMIIYGALDEHPNEGPERKLDQRARNLASQQLRSVVPSNIELVIL